MFRLWISLLAISIVSIWATAVASAQDAEPFAFEDAPFDVMPPAAGAWADLVAGGATVSGDRLVATLQLALLPPEMQPGAAYVFVFSTGVREMYMGVGALPTVTFLYGPWDESPTGMTETTGTITPGPGGTLTIEMPLSELGNATLLTRPQGYTLDVKPELTPLGGAIMLDDAEGIAELALPRAPSAEPAEGDEADPAGAPAESVPGATSGEKAAVPGAAALVALVGLALAASRRSR